MNRSLRLAGFALLITLFALAACQAGTDATTTEESTPELLPLKMGMSPFLSNAPLFIAKEEGYFQEAGLDMEFVMFESSREALPTLIQGQLDLFGPTTSTALLNAFAQGAPLMMVADKGSFVSGDCYASLVMSPVLAENGGLESLDSLEGHLYNGTRGNLSDFGAERWIMDNYGLDLNDMTFERLPSEITGEALASGQVTLSSAVEPTRTRLLESGQAVEVTLSSNMLPDTQWTIILFGPNIIEDNPELGKRFMVAYLRAVRQYNQGKTDRNIQIIAESTDLEPDEVEKLCWPTIGESLEISAEPLQDYIEWAVELELIDQSFDITDHIDMSYVDYAMSVVDGSN